MILKDLTGFKNLLGLKKLNRIFLMSGCRIEANTPLKVCAKVVAE
jgi:hypothetical protein